MAMSRRLMNLKALIFCIMLFGLLAGCMSFPMVGSYGKNSFQGTARYNTLSGTSRILLEGATTKMRCEGDSYATYAPLLTLSGAGYGGKGELRCDDGNFFRVRWESTSWGKGFGIALDQNRDKFFFVYGMDDAEAKEFITKELLEGKRRLD